jgi:hypothetical protein
MSGRSFRLVSPRTSRDAPNRRVSSTPAARRDVSENQFGAVPLRSGSPMMPDTLLHLQRSVGNRAVVSLLAGERPRRLVPQLAELTSGPVAVQRWRAQGLIKKTRMRENLEGHPNPARKVGDTILEGDVVTVDDTPVTEVAEDTEWTRVKHQGTIGWIRTSKLKDPSSPAERVREGVLALKERAPLAPTRGVSITEKLRPTWYLEELKVLPQASYLAEWRRNTTASDAEAGEAFTHPVTNKTYIKKETLTNATVFHEMLHKASSSAIKIAAGKAADEGITEYVRLRIQPPGLGDVHPKYQRVFVAIEELAATAGEENAKTAIFKAYFAGDISDLRNLVNENARPRTTAGYLRRIQFGGEDDELSKAKKYLNGKTAFDVWCAVSKAEYGGYMRELVAGSEVYEDYHNQEVTV